MENNENNSKKKEKKEYLFSFAKINKYFIIPFLCPIFCTICNYFIDKISNDEGLKNKECCLAIIECGTLLGSGLLYFISSLRDKDQETRKKKSEYNERIASIKLIYHDTSKKTKKQILIIYSLLLIMSLSVSFFDIIEVNSFDKHTFEERFYLILFISLFSNKILKAKIYNHQILSLSIALIGFILLFIPIILEINENDFYINILFFISSIFFSLYLVLIKYLTHTYFISPYLCLLFIGSISTLFTFLYFVVYSLIYFNNLSFIINSFDFSELKLGKLVYIYITIIIVCGSFLQTFSILTIYFFSPTLFMVTDSITPFFLWIIKIISNENVALFKKIINVSGYFIVLISSLIFNEIIICNFCGFNKYTKKSLEKRQKDELILLKQTESENSKYNENDNNNSGNEYNNNNNSNNDENDNNDQNNGNEDSFYSENN